MGGTVIYVDKETFDAIRNSIASMWVSFAFLHVLPAVFVSFFSLSIYIPLALYLAYTLVLIGFFFVIWRRYRVYRDLDRSILHYSIGFVLIFLVFNVVAFFFWFSMPRGPGIIYAVFYYLEFTSFLACSACASLIPIFFLKSVLDFSLWIRGRIPTLPYMYVSLKHPEDKNYYVIHADADLLYVVFALIFVTFVLHSWIILTFQYITIFTPLHILLVLYVPFLMHMLDNDAIKRIIEIRGIVAPRAEEDE